MIVKFYELRLYALSCRDVWAREFRRQPRSWVFEFKGIPAHFVAKDRKDMTKYEQGKIFNLN